ncbi:MAG TPA: hypothetical protein VGS20_06565 [Candidatus Acidoferrales bacterium]|nr:hypothetical protein [Candidatus Acidoferrales bacterium]
MFRQALALALSALLAIPLWAGPSAPAGTIASSNGATVSGTAAAAGSSVFSGDTVAVPGNGGASVTLTGGSRVLLGSDTEARVLRTSAGFSLEIVRGGAAFTSSSKSAVEGQLADLTFRPANPNQDSAGTLAYKGSSRALLVANKGDWIVTTGRDGRSMILHSGERIEGAIGPDQNSNSNDQDQQNKKKKRRLGAFLIGGAIVGGATGLALAYGQSECTNPLVPNCVVSPVVP